MKYRSLILWVCCFAFSSLFAAEEFEGTVTIGSVQDYSGENNAGAEVEGVKFNTSQRGAELKGFMRVSIEMTDKNKDVYWGKIDVPAPELKLNAQGKAPTGIIEWIFEVETGEMKRPKITGYSIEYGYKEDKNLIVLDAEFDDVDSLQELEDRNTDSKELKVKCAKKRVQFDYSN